MITPAALRAAYVVDGTIKVPTSGTSGQRRWVVRTARSWVESFEIVAGLAGLSASSRAWIPGPAAASMNSFAICLVDHLGAELVTGPERATHLFCTPAGLHRLLDSQPLAAVRRPLTLVVAGDRLAPDLADQASSAGHTVHHYYGAAQLSFVAWGRDAESLRAFPQVRMTTVDGELWVSSPWLCLMEEQEPAGDRALRNSTVSKARNDSVGSGKIMTASPVLRTRIVDDETWMSVGDRGEMTPDGRIVVAGRPSAITTGGVTVVSAEVESVLRQHARGQIAVVGRPHRRLGAILVGVCTDPRDRETLPVIARRLLPASHRPRAWTVLPEFPLTEAGKIDRIKLANADV